MANVKIVLDLIDNASSGLDAAAGGLVRLEDAAKKVAVFGLGVATAATGAFAAGMGVAISEAMDAEKNFAQLEAVIKSTGGAAGVTAQEVADMASALAAQTTYTDDAILEGQNLLLTFTNIGKDVFPTATQALVDMASAMGTDVKSGAIQLGKALNDPVQGITALTRVGVAFTDEQKNMIKAMVEAGDVAGAQTIILDELAKEFGGSAAAQADTLAGRLENTKNRMFDMAEGIGMSLLPALTTLFDEVIAPALPVIEDMGAAFAWLVEMIAGGNGLSASIEALGDIPWEDYFGPEIGAMIYGIIDALAVFTGETIPAIIAGLEPVGEAAVNLASAFGEQMPMVMAYFGDMVAFVQGLVDEFAPALVANISTALNAIAEFWREHGDEVMAIINFLFRIVTATIGGALTLISGFIAAGTTAITAIWSAFSAILQGDWSKAWDIILAAGNTAWETIKSTVTSFLEGVLSIVGTNLDEFVQTWTTVFEQAKTIAGNIWEDIKTGVSNFVASLLLSFNDLVANIQGAFALDWGAIGSGIISGIGAGIAGAIGGLAAQAAQAALSALNAARAALGIKSPSSAFAEVGRQMMAGMSVGIIGGTAGVSRATQTAAQVAIQAATGSVTNRSVIFNVNNYGASAEETTARLRALAGAF